MSGHGEMPGEDEEKAPKQAEAVGPGETVYNSKGEVLGEARGIAEAWFFRPMREGIEAMSIENAQSGD